MAASRSTALYGQLGIFSLNTVLSALNLQQVTGRLTLAQYDKIAEIVIRSGEVVDAWNETERGINALLPLFGWENGVFSFNVQPAETQTINIPLPILQVRSAVYLEEHKNGRGKTFFTKEIPSGHYVLDLNREPSGDVSIKPEHWDILRNLVTGPQTVEKLAELTNTRLEAFVPVAAELVRANLLRVMAPNSNAH